MKLSSIQKYYLTNLSLFIGVILSIYLMFYVQFMVKDLQDQVDKAGQTISNYEDEIKVLEVEWVYLTRPERLRFLANKYLQNNNYIASNQIKKVAKLEPYYLANLEKYENEKRQVAMDSAGESIAMR